MPDDVSFLTIPANLLDPGSYVEFDNSRADGALPALSRTVLAFGQRLPTGTVSANTLTRVYGQNDGKTFFGRGSMLAAMVEAKFVADDSTPMYVIASDDNPAGVAAVWSALFAGTATSAGTISLYIGGSGAGMLTSGAAAQIQVTVGMTPAQASAAMTAAIAALPDLPVTAVVDQVTTAQCDIACRWKGASGNDLDLRQHLFAGDNVPTGLTLTITQATQGSGNPVLTGAIAAMGTKWFTDVILPYTDGASTTAVSAELERRWGSTVQQDAMAYAFSPLTLGALATLGNSLDEKLLSLVGMPKTPTASWVCAAVIGTMSAYYLTIDPAAPLDSSILLPGIEPPASGDRLQHADRETIMHDGIATLAIDQGGNVTFNRMITTYQFNGQGISDESYLDVEALATLAYLRYWVRARIATRWPRYKLADDPTSGSSLPRGARTTCPKLIGIDLVAGSGQLYKAGIIDNVAEFAANLVIKRSTVSKWQVNAVLPWQLINRFRVFAAQIQFRL